MKSSHIISGPLPGLHVELDSPWMSQGPGRKMFSESCCSSDETTLEILAAASPGAGRTAEARPQLSWTEAGSRAGAAGQGRDRAGDDVREPAAGQDEPCGEAGGGQEVDHRAHRQATSPLPGGHASLPLVMRNWRGNGLVWKVAGSKFYSLLQRRANSDSMMDPFLWL